MTISAPKYWLWTDPVTPKTRQGRLQIAILTKANLKLSDDNKYLAEENKELKQQKKQTKASLVALANTL
jgi:hypothetical protein